MNESNKTLGFVGVAVLVGLLAWFTQPRAIIDEPVSNLGPFFPKFENPLAAKTLEITEFDEDQGALIPFKVTQVNGIWTIPSHSNYPADASKQMADAATSLIDVKKLALASTNPADHEILGVIDPTSADLSAGSRGVGKKVVVLDGGRNVLAQFIIGKADGSQTGVRFVRVPGQDPVYRVEMNVDKLTTKFGDWIEKDLLKLNAFDVRQLALNDYSVDEARGLVEQRALLNLNFDSKDNKWQLASMEVFKDKKGLEPEHLGPNQELNNDKLNDLKTALDDLQIIDVSRKPAGLAADLRVEDKLAQDRQAKVSLAQHGFYVVPFNKQMVLFSNEGEVLCGTSEGVEYVLRFGEIAGAEHKDKEKKEADKKADKPEAAGVSRYIMVTTRFNDKLLPKPELQALPGPQPEKKEPAKKQPVKEDKKKSSGKDEKSSGDKSSTDAKPAADAKTDGKAADDEESDEAEEEPAKPAEAASGDKKPAAEADKKAAPDKEEKKADAKEEKPKTEADLERERIEKENKQKQDEYDSKVSEGKKKVQELNGRFADWYYIISDATYQKIHLGRKDVIKDKDAPKDEAGKAGGEAGAKQDPFQKFKDLKQGGLEK